MIQGTLQDVLLVLLVAAAVAIAAKRVRVHHNLALVLTGVALAAFGLTPALTLDGTVVIQVFLPILIFEAAISTDLRRLRENLLPVSLTALPGLLATVLVSGAVLHLSCGLSWGPALMLGSILAPTDTIAVIAVFRKVRAPARLTTIVENESLFNDASALVAFATALEAWRVGTFDPSQGALGLLWVVGAGLAVGLLVGHAVSSVMLRTDEHMVEIMLTVIATYGSSLLAQAAQGSAVLAMVTAGITVGTVGWPAISPTGRVAIRSVWEIASFGVNCVVFLFIGLQVDLASLAGAVPAIGWGLVALTLGRMAAVYPFLALVSRGRSAVPLRWQHLLVWGNLKGSLSMAMALSLPAAVAEREQMVTVVFGCALVTLTLQGLTLAPLARALGIGKPGEVERRLEGHQARLLAARAAQGELVRLQQGGLLPQGLFQRLRAAYQGTIARSERDLRDLLAFNAAEEARRVAVTRRHLLTVEKGAVRDAVTSGILGEEAAAEALADIDRQLADLSRDQREE